MKTRQTKGLPSETMDRLFHSESTCQACTTAPTGGNTAPSALAPIPCAPWRTWPVAAGAPSTCITSTRSRRVVPRSLTRGARFCSAPRIMRGFMRGVGARNASGSAAHISTGRLRPVNSASGVSTAQQPRYIPYILAVSTWAAARLDRQADEKIADVPSAPKQRKRPRSNEEVEQWLRESR